MKLLRIVVSSLLPVGLLVLQSACGGDSSGPGNVATSIAANSSTTLTAPPGGSVLELPSVLVLDQSGAPVIGASVVFAVTAGGGSVTGGNTTTNPSGIATVGGWTLGTTTGTNTLTATTGGLPPVIFTANGSDPCSPTAATHTLGSTTNGQLAAADCRFQDGSFVDFYSVVIPTGGTYVFNQSSPTFDTFLEFFTLSGTPVGINDDFVTSDSRLKVIVPPGTYVIAANSLAANVVGNYVVTSAASTAPVSACEDVFVVPGINSPQSIQTSDCNTGGFFSDEYVVFLNTGQTITVSMTSSTLDSYLEIRQFLAGGGQAVLVFNDDIDGTTKNAQVSFTAQTADFYIIAAASRVAAATGDYTLVIQ